MIVHFADDDKGFTDWMHSHPTHVIVNYNKAKRKASHFKVHTTKCSNLLRQYRSGALTRATGVYGKTGAPDVQTAWSWGLQGGFNPDWMSPCGSCLRGVKPPDIHRWTEPMWVGQFARTFDPAVLAIYKQIRDRLEELGYEINGSLHRRHKTATLWPTLEGEDRGGWPPACFRLDGRVEFPLSLVRGEPAFDGEAARHELLSCLKAIPGFPDTEELGGTPTMPLQAFASNAAQQALLQVFRFNRDHRRAFQATDDPDELWRDANRMRYSEQLDAAPAGNPRPSSRMSEVRVFFRRKDVVAHVLRLAEGRCEVCHSPAPFNTADGNPYLEVHHVIRLADDGPDTVDNAIAACPNCHRHLHYGEDKVQLVDRLYSEIGRLRRGDDST